MNDFEQVSDYGGLKEDDGRWVGFAHKYLQRCKEKLQSDDEIDIDVYTQLVEVDSRLGSNASEQLLNCIRFSLRLDLIKVCLANEGDRQIRVSHLVSG